MKELISTIIPVYNRVEFLKQAVDSVLCQTYRPVEIIIVNDGSTDGTNEAANELALAYPDIIQAVHQNNGGPGKAREAGRQLAKGTFIQYLDSDDVLLPNKFRDQVQSLKKNPDCGIAYGYTSLVDENNNVLESPYKETGNNHTYLFPKLLTLRWWNTHTPLFRKEVCDQVGPWAAMRMGEDWNYDARVGAMRVKLVNCHTFVAHTRQHGANRLTGGGLDRMKLSDIANLLPTIHSCAIEGGIPHNNPEWDMFYRWAFLEMRRAANAGLNEQSEMLFDLLKKCHISQIKAKVMIYRCVQKIIGPHKSNKIFDMTASLKQRVKDVK